MSVKHLDESQLSTLEQLGMSATDVALLDGLTGGNDSKLKDVPNQFDLPRAANTLPNPVILPEKGKLSGKIRLFAHSISSALSFIARKIK